jgi:hypothetical protein
MTDIPSEIPAELRAGDTHKWTRSHPSYPASAGWVMAYVLVGPAGVFNFAATADGDDFAITVAASVSATWAAGVYTLTESVTLAGERYSTATKSVRVLANLAGAVAASDTRSHARRMLDAIEAWLELKAPTSESVEIAGRKISNYPLVDLLALRDKYRFEVSLESGVKPGGFGRKVLVRFG